MNNAIKFNLASEVKSFGASAVKALQAENTAKDKASKRKERAQVIHEIHPHTAFLTPEPRAKKDPVTGDLVPQPVLCTSNPKFYRDAILAMADAVLTSEELELFTATSEHADEYYSKNQMKKRHQASRTVHKYMGYLVQDLKDLELAELPEEEQEEIQEANGRAKWRDALASLGKKATKHFTEEDCKIIHKHFNQAMIVASSSD
jgi:hypothetical protein